MSKKTKKLKAKYEDMFECCLRAETDLRHEQQKFYEAQHEGSVAQERVRQLEGEAEELVRVLGEATAALDKVSAQRDEAEAQVAQTEHLRADLEAANRVAEDMARQREQRPTLVRYRQLETDLAETEFERVRATEQRDKAIEEITKLNNEQEAAWERGFHEGHRAATTITSERIRTLELDLKDALHAAGQRGDTQEIPMIDVRSVMAGDPLVQQVLANQPPAWYGLRDPRGPHEAGCTQDPMHTGQCHEPEAKSAIEVPKPSKDEGEGMLIAYVTAREIQEGDRVRFNGTGGRFLTVLHVTPISYDDGTEDCTITFRVINKHDSTPFGDFTYTMEGNAVVERNENP